ncbi:MAG TPA: hypothetical protein VE780_15640, partial [Thermoleophilaceae bacterium]|nr:hypothetical protein [Thermoleophilaceae bacterium]
MIALANQDLVVDVGQRAAEKVAVPIARISPGMTARTILPVGVSPISLWAAPPTSPASAAAITKMIAA